MISDLIRGRIGIRGRIENFGARLPAPRGHVAPPPPTPETRTGLCSEGPLPGRGTFQMNGLGEACLVQSVPLDGRDEKGLRLVNPARVFVEAIFGVFEEDFSGRGLATERIL